MQKLIVHNTEIQNKDPDPAATIRSIYYYLAVTYRMTIRGASGNTKRSTTARLTVKGRVRR